jgi:hypothetical protein
MYQPVLAQWLAALSALLAMSVSAQTATAPAAAPVAQTQPTPGPYRSALEGYQPYSESKMVPWREANDRVGEIGGWRVYAKEAAGGQAPANQAPATGGAAKPPAGQAKP